MTAAVPRVSCALLWKLPMASVAGAAAAAGADRAVTVTAPSDSLTVLFTNSRSGRKAYQPPMTATMASPIMALRLRIVHLLRSSVALGTDEAVPCFAAYKLAAVEMVPTWNLFGGGATTHRATPDGNARSALTRSMQAGTSINST